MREDQVSYISSRSLTLRFKIKTYEMLCAIWYHLHNLINVKNTHSRVLLLVKLQAAGTYVQMVRMVFILNLNVRLLVLM